VQILLFNVFVNLIAGAVFGLLKKATYYVVGKIQKKKNDATFPKDHRS